MRRLTLLILVILLVACAGSPTPAQRSAPVILPTDTAAPKAATVRPPTATKLPATSSPIPPAATAARTPTPTLAYRYIGNQESKIFHRPTCRMVDQMNEGNKIFFKAREDATNRDYKPCGICDP